MKEELQKAEERIEKSHS